VTPLRRIANAIRWRVDAWRERAAVSAAFRVLHGPARVDLGDRGVGVVCLMKDAAWFAEGFLRHHFGLGADHVVILDNGSTDATCDIAAAFDRVTVLRNTLPARRHESLMRTLAAQRTFRSGWVLFADADEMAEVPFAGPQPFARLIPHLERTGASAVVGQMLDLYDPAGARGSYAEAVAGATHYALSAVESLPYHDTARIGFAYFLRDNRLTDPVLTLKSGGLRAEVFGEQPFLSKHSLVRNRPGAQLMTHPHCASGVTVADVTLVLRHYKLAGDWRARDAATVAAGAWDHGEDARRLQGPATIAPAQPLVWQGAERLVEQGFLHASDSARQALSGTG
jgi:hypothetical protein